MIQDIKVCNIYAPDKEDFDFLVMQFSKYPVLILNEIPEIVDGKIPSLIVGCLAFKEKFPEYNLFDKVENINWAYSSKEKKRDFKIEINEFVTNSLKSWLPTEFLLYDPFLNGNFDSFIEKNLDLSKITFVYYSSGALYLNNDSKNFILNIKSMSFMDSDFKIKIFQFLSNENFLLYSYANVSPIVNPNEILRVKTLENICWIKFGVEIEEDVFFNIFPGIDIKKNVPFLMSGLPMFHLNEEERICLHRLQEKDFIVRWISKSYICFSFDFQHENFKTIPQDNHLFGTLNFSHKRTITGRIVCKDSYNIQNIPKEGDEKSKIVSRFHNGTILVCDYVSFESKIALYKSEDENFIKNYADKDLHLETAKIIFGDNNISDFQRKFSKDINHAIMFGAGEDLLLKRLSEIKNAEEVLYKIRLFLSPILNKSFNLNKFQKEHGYIVNDWGYIINPRKEFAAFNNYIQSTAAEILIDKLFEIREYLKNKESKFLFPVHDCMVFDISPKEKNLQVEIPKLLTNYKGEFFSISAKFGPNYKEISNEKIY